MVMSMIVRTEQTVSQSDQNSSCSTFESDQGFSHSSSTDCSTNLNLTNGSGSESGEEVNTTKQDSAFDSDAEIFSDINALRLSHQAEIATCKQDLRSIVDSQKANTGTDKLPLANVQRLENLTLQEFLDLKQIIVSNELDCRYVFLEFEL